MRLLDCKTLKLEEFYDSDIPAYAILSHTWEKGQEVTYQDLQALERASNNSSSSTDAIKTIKAKTGYDKIVRSAQLALADNWPFVWIDTCCIDKTSSAELSEAINSMYQWYKNSSVCYAYLADVFQAKGHVEEQLFDSRWFTRGWTLQELLAPEEVQFFAHDWTYIGHRSSQAPTHSASIDLSQEISVITGVDIQTLRDRVLDRASVAQRMSWAAKRRTSRREDAAYCLLGLFNINMPLLYGEGDKAFIRLQEEIIKTSDDHTIFAWRNHKIEDPHTRYSGMLAPSIDAFTDAENIIRTEPERTRRPYAMTNIGLRIELPLLNASSSQNRVLCVLNCRYNSSHPVSRLGVYLAEPWTFNHQVFLSSQKPGALLQSHDPELHGIARDNAESSPIKVEGMTTLNREQHTTTLYISAFPRPHADYANSQSACHIQIRRSNEGQFLYQTPTSLDRFPCTLDTLSTASVLLVQPLKMHSILVVLLRMRPSAKPPSAVFILEFWNPQFTPARPGSRSISKENIKLMLNRCCERGMEHYDNPFVWTNMAKRSFGDFLVVDLYDTLGDGLIGSRKAITRSIAFSEFMSPASDELSDMAKQRAALPMPWNVCLRVRLQTQEEFESLFEGDHHAVTVGR